MEYEKQKHKIHTDKDNLGKPSPERKTILDFEERHDEVAVALAGPCTEYLHLAPENHNSIFTAWMIFLTSNEQCQSTEDNFLLEQ